MTVVHVRIKHNLTPEQLGADPDGAKEFARATCAAPGFRWKIWTVDEASSVVGGVYLFDDRASARAYFDGNVFAGVRHNPGFLDIRTDYYEVNEEPSQWTNAPLAAAAGAR